MAGRKRRFAVLLCAEDSDYVRKMYGGYSGVFVRLLGEEGEEWSVYRVARGELPADGDVDGFDGFVITGSCNDAHGEDEWIGDLVALLRRLIAARKRVLGVCFGHQILSRALGGKTGRARNGWDVGITSVHLSPPAQSLFSSLRIPSSLSVIECHRDEVYEVPPHVEVMALSQRTGVEMFRYGNHIMGIQGHPEYTKDILHNLIDRLLKEKMIENCEAERARLRIEEREPDRDAWKRLCKGFLNGRLFLERPERG